MQTRCFIYRKWLQKPRLTARKAVQCQSVFPIGNRTCRLCTFIFESEEQPWTPSEYEFMSDQGQRARSVAFKPCCCLQWVRKVLHQIAGTDLFHAEPNTPHFYLVCILNCCWDWLGKVLQRGAYPVGKRRWQWRWWKMWQSSNTHSILSRSIPN